MPDPVADAIAAEDSLYAAMVSEYRGLRRQGATVIEAALLTAAAVRVAGATAEDDPDGQS